MFEIMPGLIITDGKAEITDDDEDDPTDAPSLLKIYDREWCCREDLVEKIRLKVRQIEELTEELLSTKGAILTNNWIAHSALRKAMNDGAIARVTWENVIVPNINQRYNSGTMWLMTEEWLFDAAQRILFDIRRNVHPQEQHDCETRRKYWNHYIQIPNLGPSFLQYA